MTRVNKETVTRLKKNLSNTKRRIAKQDAIIEQLLDDIYIMKQDIDSIGRRIDAAEEYEFRKEQYKYH